MKIDIMTTWNAKCGIATYSAYLAEALQNEGHKIRILAEKKEVLPSGYDPNFPYKEIPFVECWSRNQDFQELINLIKKDRPFAVNIQHQFGLFPYEDNLTELLKNLKEMGIKVVLTLHDVIPYTPNMEKYFESMVKFSDKIIVHNETCKRLMETQWKAGNKVVMIYHGTKIIDVPSVAEARKILKLPLDKTIILSWGFIWESKGLTELIEIFAELKKDTPDLMFIHAGGLHPVFSRGDYLKNILTKAFKLGIRPKELMITGFVDEKDIGLYFGCSNIIVLNYMRGSASASGAAHRALSSGKPIVGTDDICIQEIPKFEVPKMDKQSLLKGIKTVLGDSDLQKSLIKKEKEMAEKTSWKNTALEYLKTFA